DAPKANVLDAAMIGALHRAFDAARAVPELKALVITAEGRHFSFGASVEEHLPEHAAAMLRDFHAMFRALFELSLPSFAAVRGACLGGGLELASACSWIVAHPEASFAQPEIRLGVFPPMATVLLAWRLGAGVALDLCVSGRSVGALEAQRIGLVHAIVDDPREAARAFFEENLAPLSASSLRFAERAVRASLRERLDRELPELERLYLDELMKTPDAVEGLQAFLAKRAPQWNHAVAPRRSSKSTLSTSTPHPEESET
ncbi:MAG: enoyl-CoA hydratase/isomerase family protein, partial [Polyangiales bacterium]